MTVIDHAERLANLREELRDMAARHLAEKESLEAEICVAESTQAHEAAGTTEEELMLARGLVEVYAPNVIDEQVIQEAVEDIDAGCLTLRSEYFARRHYEGNVERETYSYGMGPKHGNVVFSIGLSRSALAFFRKWNKVPMGEDGDAVNAAIRYLLNLKEAGQP